MKPRNKFQKRITELSKKLPKITDAQIKWAYKNCIEHIGQKTAKGIITCLECNHQWTDTRVNEYCRCPHCKIKLNVLQTRKRSFLDYQYLCIVTACEGFQVLRFVYVQCNSKKGEAPRYFSKEVVQRWMAPDGKYATMARLRPMGYFAYGWIYHSKLEIRPEKSLYNIIPTKIYPRQKLIPEVERSGYDKQFYKLTPFDLFHFLLNNSKAETLLKTKHTGLFSYFAYDTKKDMDAYWASIRICIRNRYFMDTEDVPMWCDYIDLLRFFGKDLHNAKYVCPQNLRVEHDRYVKKRIAYLEKQKAEEKKKKALEDEKLFQEMKSKFFGIEFTDGLIRVRVLESVEEIIREGDLMHHCVFASEYHLKPDSLILSAYTSDKKLETIELSLSELKVLQSRGACNKNTQYHDRIINLVNSNTHLIQQRLTA